MTLDAVRIYPVKSAADIDLDRSRVEPAGLEHDRRWMVVLTDGRFLTRRDEPQLAGLAVRREGDHWALSFHGQGEGRIPVRPAPGPERAVRIWNDEVPATEGPREASAWLSDRLGREVRLVFVTDGNLRPVEPRFAEPGDRVGFADAYPVLAVTTASVAAVSEEAGRTLSASRFRPNLVISTTEPFAEDGWGRIRIGDVTFDVAKPCKRCVVVDRDPDTGRPDEGVLRALGRIRRVEGGVLFGENLIPRSVGVIRRGDPVEVLRHRTAQGRPVPL